MNKQLIMGAAMALFAAGSYAQAAGELAITEWMYQGAGGEFIEVTNIAAPDVSGANDINLTGYKYDDDSASYSAGLSLGTGILKPGESLIITESNATIFKAEWDLATRVSYPIIVIGNNTINIGRADFIYIFDANQNIVDRLQYNDQVNPPGGPRTQNVSGITTPAFWTANQAFNWFFSAPTDGLSWTSLSGSVGNPGISQ